MKDEMNHTSWQSAIRGAMERASVNVDLHIERDIYDGDTARAVVQEYTEQLQPLLDTRNREPAPRISMDRSVSLLYFFIAAKTKGGV